MKPNDKAYAAARKMAYNRINKCFVFDLIKEAVDAAYAAQFPPSEDYAGLISALRTGLAFSEKNNDAADALEAVLAERDDFAEQLALRSESGMAKDMQEIMRINNELLAERDTLLARIEPVDDKELVEIAADAISTYVPDQVSKWGSIKDAAIDAIAAIRPHIEAAERERCAKIADKQGWCAGSAVVCGPEIAAAIRSGK